MKENTVFLRYISAGLGTMKSNFSRKVFKFTFFFTFSFHCMCFLFYLFKRPIKMCIVSKAATGRHQKRFWLQWVYNNNNCQRLLQVCCDMEAVSARADIIMEKICDTLSKSGNDICIVNRAWLGTTIWKMRRVAIKP